MELLTCPHCKTRVIPSADGACPSCRRPFDVIASKPPLPAASPFAEMAFTPTEQASEVSDPSNPYAAPRFTVDAPAPRAAKPPRGGVLWMLFSFEGRIPRRVYWGTRIIAFGCFYAVMFAIGGILQNLNVKQEFENVFIFVLLPFCIPMVWIELATSAKRWHDRDKSGWWYLISFIPYVGPIWIFVENGCLRGTVGPNQYGPDPT
jgi:uncharacterized membrane protein YhaH (DUF805 family)